MKLIEVECVECYDFYWFLNNNRMHLILAMRSHFSLSADFNIVHAKCLWGTKQWGIFEY